MALSEKRLLLALHVPKTGGTTLSHILQREICGRVDNLMGQGGFADTTSRMAAASLDRAPKDKAAPVHLVFRGWRDWLDVYTRREELIPRAAVIFEGGVWGAHHLIGDERRIDYVTTIRNPINTFRSNFNYGKRRYGVHRDIRRYVDEYGANIFTNLLGHGDLDLAKRRLEFEYSAFTVLEEFEISLSVLAERLDLRNVSFGIRNRSGSEKLALEPDVQRYFWERNDLDRRLYDFARELVIRRHAGQRTAGGPVPTARNTEGEGEFPTGFQQRDESILEALDQGDADTAIARLRAIENPDFGASMNLGRLLMRKSQPGEAAASFERAFASQPNVALREVVDCYMAFAPDKALQLLEDEHAGMTKIPESETFDDVVSREKATVLEMLARCADQAGRAADTAKAAHRGIALIKERVASGQDTALFAAQRKQLLVLLIKAAAKAREIQEARNALRLYLQEDPQLESMSLRENPHIRQLAPSVYAKQIFRRVFGLRASGSASVGR